MARVLTIEDDPHIAKHMAEALRPWDHNVVCEDGTRDVLQALQDKEAELVVLGIGLPQRTFSIDAIGYAGILTCRF